MDFERATAAATRSPAPTSGSSRRCMPSYRSTLADLFGVRLIAIGVPVEQIDKSLKPGDLEFHRAHQGRLRLRKSARAAARDAGDGMAQGRFRRDDRDGGWPRRRSAPHGAAGKGAGRRAERRGRPAPRGSCAIANTEIVDRGRCAVGRHAGAQRRLASVVAGDASTAAEPKSSAPTCCSAPSRCRRANTPCASRSSRCAARGGS